jgi:hypothetical protein
VKALAVAIILAVTLVSRPVWAAQAGGVETDPIRCWWRTTAPAVRVGEAFSIVLTCSVVETDTVTVVPNEAELSPNAMQLPPFDVIGGSHGDDLRTPDRRFFQYEYRVRLVSDEFFGKDVDLPEMKLSYKVRTRVENEAVEGRDQTYVLPETAVRVLSLVPDGAADIRDASVETFEDLDRRFSRANLLRVTGIALMAFAGLAAIVAVARLAGGARGRRAAPRAIVSDMAVLRAVGRELSAIRRARADGEWTAELRARLLTALRVLGGYALELPVTGVSKDVASGVSRTEGGADGALAVRSRGLRGATVIVPAWVTPAVIAQEVARVERAGGSHRVKLLEELQDTLGRLTAAEYGREKAAAEEMFDSTLALASSVLRRLKIENTWIGKRLRRIRFTRTGLEQKLWSH